MRNTLSVLDSGQRTLNIQTERERESINAQFQILCIINENDLQ